MKTIEKYKGGSIVSNKDKLYRVEGKIIDRKALHKKLSDKSSVKVIADQEYSQHVNRLIKKGIMMYIKQIYIKGYPQVYAFMAPIICPNGEHPDIAGGISLDKIKAIKKTLGEATERYYIFNYNKKALVRRKLDISNHMKKIGLTYFHGSQNLKDIKTGLSSVLMKEGISLITGKKVLIPASFVYIPYKTSRGEDYIGEGTSTGASSHETKDKAIMNGIEEVIERHVNMKIRYNKIVPPLIDIATIKDKKINKIISLLKKNGVELSLLDTTDINDFKIPSVLILAKNNAGGLHAILTSSCKSTLRAAILKALEEVLQGQTWEFLLNKYPDFKPTKDYSNIKYFFHHILMYANKKNEKYLSFLSSGRKIAYKDRKVKGDLINYIKKIKEIGKDCYIVNLMSSASRGIHAYKTFITHTYQLNRDNNAKFLGNIDKIKSINIMPHPFG